MIGDTVKIFAQAHFNTDVGTSIIQNDIFDIVIDK